jgi:hypothetical protein
MISFKSSLSYLGLLVTGVVLGIAAVPRKRHYALRSPQNLARLERGRRIKRTQQLAQSAAKRELKRQKLLNKLNQL